MTSKAQKSLKAALEMICDREVALIRAGHTEIAEILNHAYAYLAKHGS